VAEVVHQLGTAHEQLRAPAAPAAWCAELGRIAHELFEVSDDDAWHWDVVHRALDDLASDAQAACWPPDEVVPADELARLLAARFQGLPGPARFGTGAVTLSSLVALRGVPHPVVCLLGLDADLLGAAVPAADDLMALDPHVGDRDAGRELRATLLDALLATGDRLVLVSTGRDLRTNTEIPPAVPIAELMDLVDATAAPVHGPDGRPRPAHHGLAVDHPRQSWSERNFLAGQLGRAVPFSHDAGALAAARVRHGAPEAPDDALLLDPEDLAEWNLDSLIGSVEQPARALLRDRLGVVLPDRAAVVPDLIPLSTDALGRWQLSDDLLHHRSALGDEWDSSRLAAWAEIRRRSGRLPPMGFGELPAEEAAELIDTLLGTVESLGLAPCFVAATRSVDITVPFGERTVRVAGEVTGVIDDTVVVVTPSKLSGKHLLGAWLRLAALTAGDPDRPWAAVVVARDPDKNTTTWRRLRVHDPGQALVALTTALDLAVRARRSVVPFTAATGWAWHLNGKAAARSAWKGHQGSGDADDAWVVQALGRLDFEELLAVPPLDDETDPTWGESPSRFVRWSDRLWGTFTKTVALEPDDEHRDD
jgi:exodeoxyribonuclease V gamma subunit